MTDNNISFCYSMIWKRVSFVSWTLAKLSTYGQTVSIDKRTCPYPRERGWVVHVIYIDEEVLIPHNLGI